MTEKPTTDTPAEADDPAEAPDTASAAWRDHVFCMISPDCIRRGLTGELLARLRAAGVEPVGWLLGRIGAHRVDVMSELQGVAPGAVYRFRTLDALFDLGPSLMVVLRDRGSRGPDDLYRALADLKGHADPRKSTPGTIRHDLRGLNIVMSLLHVSDGPAESARESAVLAGTDHPSGFYDAAGLDALVATWEATVPRETRELPEVLAAARTAVLSKLWHLLSPSDRQRIADVAARGALADPALPEEVCQHLEEAGADPALTGFLRAPFTGSGPHPDLPAVQHRLTGDAAGLDPWSIAVLATSTYFPARGREAHG